MCNLAEHAKLVRDRFPGVHVQTHDFKRDFSTSMFRSKTRPKWLCHSLREPGHDFAQGVTVQLKVSPSSTTTQTAYRVVLFDEIF